MKHTKRLSVLMTLIMLFFALNIDNVQAAEQTKLYYAEPMFTAIVSTEIDGKDASVIQDGDLTNEYNTYQGDNKLPCVEWYGYTFDKTYTIRELEFTEGSHFWNGGYFTYGELWVEVLIDGKWSEVDSTIDPHYMDSDNWEDHGDPFESFAIDLDDDIACQGVRVCGQAGGAQFFTTCAELRVKAYLTESEIENVKEAVQMMKDAEKAILLNYYKKSSGKYKSGIAIGQPNDGWVRLEMENTSVATIIGGSLQESGFFSGGKAAAAFDYNNDTLRPADVAPNMENISHVTITYDSPNAGDTYAKLCYNGGGCASGILVMLNDQEAFLVETVYSTDESTPCWITIPLTLVKGLNTIYISCSVQNEAGQKTWLNYDFLDIKDPTVEYTPVTDLPEESTSDTETTEPETTESEESAETSTLDTTEMVSDSIDAVDSNSDTTVTTSYSTDTKSEKPGADEVHKVPVALIVSIAIAVVAVAIVVVLVLKKKKS